MKYEPFDWYEQALYYDIIFDTDTDQEAGFLRDVHQRHVDSGGRAMLEPACGSGRLVSAMTDRSFDVTGFDISPGMLGFARQRLREDGLKATLVEASMESFASRISFDIAHCLVSTFKHLRTAKAVREHLTAMGRALKVGGVYVLGLHMTDYGHQRYQRERWTGRRDGIEVTCNIQSWPPDEKKREERMRSRMIVREEAAARHLESHWVFRTYSFSQLRRLIVSTKMFEHIATYDFNHDIRYPIPFDGEQLDVVLVLKKTSHH